MVMSGDSLHINQIFKTNPQSRGFVVFAGGRTPSFPSSY